MVWVLTAEPLSTEQGEARKAEMDALKAERKGMDQVTPQVFPVLSLENLQVQLRPN